MKKIFLSLSFLIFASLFVFSTAQTEKKIIIKKKIVDANGNVTVEETILTGEDAENVNINDYINEDGDDGEIDIDVNIEKIIEEAEGTEGMKIFKFDGKNLDEIIRNSEGISDEIKLKLKNIDLGNLKDLDISKAGERRIIIMSDGENMLEEDIDEMLEGFEWNGSQTFTFSDENKDKKAFLGVWPGDSDNDKGVVIGGTVKGSAAEKGGLIKGDIITTIGGKSVKSFSELAAVIKEYKPGELAIIQYIRDAEAFVVSITLGENKPEPKKHITYKFNNDHDHSLSKETKEEMFMMGKKPSCCTKEVEKAYIGIMIENSEHGNVKIVDVNREDEVLMTNDVITKFGKTKVSDIDELINAVSEYEPGDKVKVQYIRNGESGKSKVTLLARIVKEGCCTAPNCCPDKQESTKTEIIIKKQQKEIKSDSGSSLLELEDVKLYPNPSEGKFQLKFTSQNLAAINITITDANGREIIRDEIADFNGTYAGEFNLKGNTPGLYLVNITQEGKVLTEKIIIR